MSCIWVSARECNKNELFQLTELVRKDRDLRIVFSYEPLGPVTKKATADSKINDLLVRLGVRANLKGFLYLETGIKICLEDREELDGITKRLYPSIARKHGTSPDKVEHAIRHAIEVSWMKGNKEEQKEVFGYDSDEGRRPTNAEFITRITDYIENRNQPVLS